MAWQRFAALYPWSTFLASTTSMYFLYEQYLRVLRNAAQLRTLSAKRQDCRLDFCTNNYLGLAERPDLADAGCKSAQKYGVGSTGSRLLSGNFDLCAEFEKQIAQDVGTEESLVFASGFQANLSALSSLLSTKALRARPIVFFDRLNHSSLYQAVFLSQAELVRYRHNDVSHLESLMKQHKDASRPKFIVTETVFGMDGDIVDLRAIKRLALEHNACLFLDEAHAVGVYGKRGYGVSTTIALSDVPHVISGTLSKAVGVSGGYIACNRVIRDFLVNAAGGFIYSTAPSPLVLGAALHGWRLVADLEDERRRLIELSSHLRNALTQASFDMGKSQTHIVPIVLGSEEACLTAHAKLQSAGINVACIRPPTVPPKSARLRISLTAHHTARDVDALVLALKDALHS